MVLKWNPMSKNLQIYIGLLHVLLVILNSSPASTKPPSDPCPDGPSGARGECIATSKKDCEDKGGVARGRCNQQDGWCCLIQGCINDDGCPDYLACDGTQCIDPCLSSPCDDPELPVCRVVNHEVDCIAEDCNPDNDEVCATREECDLEGVPTDTTCSNGFAVCCKRKPCVDDSQCDIDLACIGDICTDPCKTPGTCACGATCTVIDRSPSCDCPDGFIGDPFDTCFPEKCEPDEDGIELDCLPSDICLEKGGRPTFSCNAGFGVCCSVQDCDGNGDCPLNLACIDSTCQNPCPVDCGDQACTVVNHIAQCEEIVQECKFDDDCPSKLACRCREGGDFDCIDLPCNCDENCPDNLACIDSSCSDPCVDPEACGVQATCTVVEHEAVCDCPPDFTGDPDQVCFPTSCDSSSSGSDVICFTSEEECSNQGGIPTGNCASGFGVCCLRKSCDSNTDCPSNLACIDSYCSNPCGNLKTCGFHAMCAVHNHQPNCYCPDHYTGNAADICYPTRCKSACGLPGDCLSREACAKQHGIPDGSCASGLGVCCVDSKYCDHPGYINKLSCRPTPKYTPPPPSPPSPPSPPPPPSYPSLPSPPSPPEVVYRKKNPVKKTLKRRP